MAEKFLQSKLYEYRANSNLVLEADRDSRRRDDATGEVSSLKSHIGSIRMGERATARERHHEFEPPSKKQKANSSDPGKKNSKSENNYQPKTAESRRAFEELLTYLERSVGDVSNELLRGCAEEILEIVKDPSIPASSLKRELSRQVPTLSEEQYRNLISLCGRISDFHVCKDTVEDSGSNNYSANDGMAVVFDEDEDEIPELDEEEDDIPEGSELVAKDLDVQISNASAELNMPDSLRCDLNVHDLDAYWIQRQLARYYSDANQCTQIAEATLEALSEKDIRLCENQLVLLLDFDKFELIKLFLHNRAKIYYCVKLKQSQSEAEKLQLENEMISDKDHGGFVVWTLLNEENLAANWSKEKIGNLEVVSRERQEAISSSDVKSSTDLEDSKVDLESLAFAEGSHLMTNTRCELPEKSWRAQKKGYEEVHVPALKPIVVDDERLIEISSLEEWMHPVFNGVRHLNRIQSKMCSSSLHDLNNLLLCAPTGSGKTNVALLCMLGVIGRNRSREGVISKQDFKIVYIAPMKALVQECVQNFGKRLEPLNITVKELSGDQSLNSRELMNTNVIVTTPEKWDVVTRKSADRNFLQSVKLVIIDEIHLLHDDRGPVLEALVARILRNEDNDGDHVRIVGLSATLPNFRDVATFLRVDPSSGLFFFDASYRPVPLQQQFVGVTEKKFLKKVQLMNEICYEKALLHAGKNQLLIFTHSRADTVKTAKALREIAIQNDTLSKFVKDNSASSEILRQEAENVKNNDLRDLLPSGFAVHHAGLQRSDRSLVEDLFADKHIQVLISTATLAWGVNLPCHTVIIKGTQVYSPEKGTWAELSPLDTLQMIGRAGRYGLDSEGEGIIITNHSELQYYLSLVNNQLPIESQLIKRLPDFLNAEIVSGTVSTLDEAVEWLGYSYLYVRMIQNPAIYGLDVSSADFDKALVVWRRKLARSALALLEKNDLIKFDRHSENITSTSLGRISSHYYITHETIAAFRSALRPTMTDMDILRLFACSSEFKHIYVKDEEKMELSRLIARVPIPIKENYDEPMAKINVLLQAYISRMKLEGYAITADMIFIQQSAGRLLRAMYEICLSRKWSALSTKVLELGNMVERKIWASQNALRQFNSIPELIVRKLERVADISWEKYLDLRPSDLGEIVKNPKMGKTIYKFVHMLPKFSVSVHAVPISRSRLQLEVTVLPDFEFQVEVHGNEISCWLFVDDCDGKQLLCCLPFGFRGESQMILKCEIGLGDPIPPQYFVRVVADRWLHSSTVVPVCFRHLILPEKFSPPTELLDLRPIPLSALSEFHKLFFAENSTLNSVQTQLFFHLNDSDDSLLVFGPSHLGVDSCLELALIRFLASKSDQDRCVVLSPSMTKAERFYRKWSMILNATEAGEVCILTGDSVVDLTLCKQSRIIISDPAHWESLSRKWRTRKVIQQCSLYLLLDLDLVDSKKGAVYEVAIARSRFIESQLGKVVRFVGSGFAAANASDVGDWLGVSKSMVFNFPMHNAEEEKSVKVVGLTNLDPVNRVSSLSRTIFRQMRQSNAKSCVIFVPNRKLGQLMSADLLSLYRRTANFNKERWWEAYEMSVLLQELVSCGIGLTYRGMPENIFSALMTALSVGNLSTLIVPFELCDRHFAAENVYITDTLSFDGHSQSYNDLDNEVLRGMSSCAVKACTIFCHASKQEQVERVLFDPVCIESKLPAFFENNLVGEIVNKTIETKEEAVDYLTWTFFYRRLPKNPNYYKLAGSSMRHISDHLSEMVEEAVLDLENGKMIAVENDMELSPLNLAMIACHYNLDFRSIELFSNTLTHKTRVKGLIDILSNVPEFEDVPLRVGEAVQIADLLPQLGLESVRDSDLQQQKLLVMLYAHFSRIQLSSELFSDLSVFLRRGLSFVHAAVDVLSSQGWLKPTLAAMELCQMIIQGQWDKDSVLMQVPHFSSELVARCNNMNPAVESVFDLLDLDDTVRNSLLQMSSSQLFDVAKFCNAYPMIELSCSCSFDDTVMAGSQHEIIVTLVRDLGDCEESQKENISKVVSARYPHEKFENWWLVLGDERSNTLLSIKRFTLTERSNIKLDFHAPEQIGVYDLSLFLMCDSYLGVDQEHPISINVK